MTATLDDLRPLHEVEAILNEERTQDLASLRFAKTCECGEDAMLDLDEDGDRFCLKCGKARPWA